MLRDSGYKYCRKNAIVLSIKDPEPINTVEKHFFIDTYRCFLVYVDVL